MDINELAREAAETGSPFSTKRQSYEFMFIQGYLAATTWYPMEEAPKDDDVLLVDSKGLIIIGYWSIGRKKWYRQFGMSPVCNPIAWTYLPVYKP